MSIEHFFKERDKGFPLPVYLLKAKDEFFFMDALGVVRESIPESERDFSLDVYDLEDSDQTVSLQEIMDTLNTVSFFASRKFVIIRNIQKGRKKEMELIGGYCENPSPQSILILFHQGDIKKDRRGLLKGVSIIDLDLKTHELPKWIAKQASVKGISLTGESVSFLADIYGDDMSSLAQEIEKLSLSGEKKITIDAVNEIITGTKTYSSFAMTEALVRGDAERVLTIYQALRDTTDKLMLLGAINWQLSRKKNIGEKSLLRCYELISEAEVRMKSTNPDLPFELLLFSLVQTLKRN